MSSSTLFSAAIVIAFTSTSTGCTSDSLKRVAYGAVQSTGQEQCMNSSPATRSIDCIRNMPYDEYQRRRAEAHTGY